MLSFAFGQRAAILDTNVARVLFRVFVGRGDPKAHAMKRIAVGRVADGAAAPPRLRLQPGADGFRRDGLCSARKPKCLVCPMRAAAAPTRSTRDNERAPLEARVVVAAAVIEQRRPLPGHAASAAACISRATGNFRRQMRGRRVARGRACDASCARSSGRRGRSAPSCLVRHARLRRPQRGAALHRVPSRRRRRRPLLGQEMRWVTRDDLTTLEFPPADDELIASAERP